MTARARLGTVAAVVAAGLVVGQLTAAPATEQTALQQVPVTSRTLVCPDLRQDGAGGTTVVTAAGGAGRAGGGLGETPAALPGGPVVRDLDDGVQGPVVVVTATGPDAGSLVAEQTTRATAGSRRGVAAVSCPAPSPDSWFVGGGTLVGSLTELLLVNVEDTPAVVDVEVWTRTGRADPRPGRGIRVQPRSRTAVLLDRLAPDRDLLALHVRATRGRVASALRVVRVDGRTSLGTDWVPQGQPPAREVVVPGLPQGPGRRTALVTNPGQADAVVSLELTTDDGQYVPEGMQAVPVPAGSSIGVDLSEELTGTPAALRVRSDGPPVLVGASVIDRQGGALREIAYAASIEPLSAPALLADVRLSAPAEITLLLSALDADAVVDLVPVAAPGQLPSPQRVSVPAATTVAVRLSRFLPPGSTGSLTVEVRPVEGLVSAARYGRERGPRVPFTTLLPLIPSRRLVPLPDLVADPGARP